MRKNAFSRMIAIGLSAVLTFSNVDLRVFAEIGEEGPRKTITNIKEIDEEIARQTLYIGASEEDIIFPDTLDVTVTYQEEIETKKKIEKDETVDPAGDASTGASTEEIDEEIPEDLDPEIDPEADPELDPEIIPEPGTPEPEDPQPEVPEIETPEPEPSPEETPAPSDNASEESGEGLIGMIFPSIKAYAASDEADLDISTEPEESDPSLEKEPEDDSKTKEGEPEEEQYEIVKEIVTITEDITLEDVKWELDKENSSFDKFSSDEAGAEFVYVPAISDLYEVEALLPTITVKILKEEVPLEYMVLEAEGVRVEGNLPVGSTLQVTPIDISEAESLVGDPDKIVLFALDVCIMLDGEEIEPDESVKVTVTPPSDISTEVLENDTFELVHFPDESEQEVVDTQVNDQGELEFEMDSFSPLVGTALRVAGDYDAEFADGKSFSQSVRVNFADAALIIGNVSYVKLKLLGNISGSVVKLDDGTFATEPFVVAETEEILISAIIEDAEGNTSAHTSYTFSNIPVYVQKGTGHSSGGGNGTYQIPSNFYGIQIETAEGYSPQQGAMGSDSYYKPNPVRDINDPVWTTSQITIENSMLDVTNPDFIVNWQDNRNYADMRPYTSDTSIDDHITDIQNSISLYYKSGSEYVSVAENTSILVSTASLKPEVVGGPFSWTITYKKLPKFVSGETPYEWYIKLSDSFYDGKKSYYQLSGLNSDGYLNIVEDGTDALTLTFTNSVTGSVNWRVGDVAATEIPALPDGTLYSDDHTTMKLYRKIGSDSAELVGSGEYSIAWTESTDRRTWNYTITGLPLYAANGDAILYYTVMDSDASAAYKYTYDNGLDSTETDKCLPGQKIYATSIGDAIFSFDKVWYDDDDQNSIDRRELAISKNITFYLWRYPSNGTLADGAPVTYNAKQYSYKLTSERAQNNSFSIGLQDFATAMGAADVTFPKYDEQGFTYVYYVTEVSGSELYKTVYWNSGGEFSGTSSDKAVLNGGKICNVRSGQIAPEVTKQWNVSAISDYVGSVCTFKLQRKEGSTWVDVDGADLTLSGFSSSKKKVTGVFGTQELYNLLGKRYEYRVIESSVKAGSGETVNLDSSEWTEESDGFSNLYTLKDYSYKAVTTYTTTVEGGKESAKATVINKLYGTKKLAITKNWTGAWNIGTNGDLTGDVVIDLKRAVEGGTASLYATVTFKKPDESGAKEFTIDYVDSEQEDFTGTYVVSGDGKTWKTQDVDVIAYTEEGQQYVYSIWEHPIETQAEHYGAEYDKSVSGKRIDLTVTNRIGGTTHKTRIDIRKVWKDDSDTSQRSNIDVYLGTYDANGNFTQVYYEDEGEQKPYKLTLTSARDYDWYIWVDGNDFIPQGSSETAAQAIANHLSIKPVDAYGRTIAEPTFTGIGEANKSITGGVVKAIAENGVYKPGYKVSVSRNGSGTSFTITNTRVASREFSFTKNWEDSANALGLRGDFLRVALFREVNDTEEEVAFIDIPTDNNTPSVTVTFNNGYKYYPAYDSNGNNYIYSVKEYICQGTHKQAETLCPGGVEPDADTVVKTEVSISATKDTTTTGYVVERTVSDTVYDLIDGTYDLLTSNVKSMLMTDSYVYTNRAAGQRSDVQFYVVWHDNAKSTERPDVYLTLYYDGGQDGAVIPFTGSYTERWEDVEAGNKFVQKAVFSGLPAADDSGRVYTYYVTEHFNNATTTYETEHYSVPLFNADGSGFNSEAVTQKTIGAIHQLVVNDGVSESDVVVDGHKLTKEESFTLTSISDTVKIEGRKLWLGIPEGIEVGHLPGAYIYLFRDSDTDHTHQLPVVPEGDTQENKMAAYGAKCVDPIENQASTAPKYVLLNSTKSMYVFGTYNTDGTVATYTEFPKYDDLGYLYKYTVREVIYNEYEHELPADIMIPNYSDNTTDLSNLYKLDEATNKRDFIVHKQWNITRSSFQTVEAKATFRLYRRELGSDGHEYKALHYAEDDTSTNDPASSATAATLFNLSSSELEFLDEETITSDDAEIRWDNYQIFAPSGKLYGYYAVEVTGDMPGYTVSLNGADSSCTEATGSGPATNNTKIEGGSMAAGDKYIGVAFANSGINMALNPEQNIKEEYFRNTYVPTGFNKITFKKRWEAKKADNSTWTEMLPNINDSVEPLTFNVYCIAKMQSSDKDNYDRINFEATDYTVTKALDTNDTTGATWDYTITFNNNAIAPIYSANGNLYTYYVAETLNSNFVKTNYAPGVSYTYRAASDASGDVLDMSYRVLTNSLKGSFGVQKIWDDFSNDYGMREGGITFDVYYRLGTTGDFTKYNSSSYILNSSNKWATTISSLPVTSNNSGNNGSNYQYRIIETGIKDTDSSTITVSPPATDDQTTKWTQNKTGVVDSGNYFASVTAGNYQVYNPADITSIATSTTRKLVNQLDTQRAVVSLNVTKKWEDEGDVYGLRPTSITISIQSSVDHGQTWTEVVSRSLTASDAMATDANTWEKVFENLPKYFGTGNNDKYMYRAVETKVGSADCTVTDSANLAGHGGAYGFAHVITGDADNGFVVNITNTLRRMDKSVKVVKRWNSNSAERAVDVALFSTNYASGSAGTGTPTEITQTGRCTLNTDSNWECTYSNLPKYNKDGQAIRYYVKEITTGDFKTQYLSASGSAAPLGNATDDLQYVSSETDSDFWVVVVNTPLTKITGTKIWSDEDNKYNLRPANVVLTLQRRIGSGEWETVTAEELHKTNASASPTVTVKGTTWSGSIDKLPLYALSDGSSPAKYQYRLAELTIPNAYTRKVNTAVSALTPEDGYAYGGTDTAQTSTVTNYLITRGDITVNKVWNTSSNADKHDVSVKLYSKNLVSGTGTGANADVPGATATLSGSNLSKTFEGLPAVNKDGNEIVYYVEETADARYDTAYYIQDGAGFAKVEKVNAKSSGTGTFEFKIVNTPLTQITGSKVWVDDNDGFGLRPASLTLTLQRKLGSGEWEDVTAEELHKTNATASPSVVVDATGSWAATIDKLPLYVLSDGANPAKYQYRLAEPGTVHAYTRDRAKEISEILPDDGYTYGGTDTAQISEVANYLVLRENAINVEKIWNTDTESQKKDVVVKLLSRNFKTGADDGTSALTVVEKNSTQYIRNLNAGVNWKAVIEDLPLKNKSGDFIVYYISETTVDGAATEYYLYNGTDFEKVQEQQVKSDAEKALLTKIINTPYTTASVEKVWSDDSNKFGTRPDSVYVKLQRKTTAEESWSDVEGQAVIELNAANSWSASVDTLPLFVEYSGADPVRYEYRFLETNAGGSPFVPLGYSLVSAEAEYVQTNDGTEAGYVNTYESDAYKTVITNTLITKSITAVKVWDDNSDAQKIRPAEITLFVDEAAGYVKYDNARITNNNLNVVPTKSSDGNTWTYVFTGLPKYAYGTGASAANPAEIAYTITEDVETAYENGFILKNYYQTTYGVDEIATTITNTAMESDGVLLVEKKIEKRTDSETVTTYAFPFKASFTRPDNESVPYTGKYYLYDASIGDEDLRTDAKADEPAYDRIELSTADGTIRIPSGKVAVLVGINTMYTYTVTENPNHAGYEVKEISVTDTSATKGTAADASVGGTYGYATGKVPTASTDAVRVIFTNQLLDYENNKYLKVENTTDVITNNKGEVLTGGEVKVFKSSVVIDSADMAHDSTKGYDYVNDQTPYIQEAMSVEFHPDTEHGYTYSDTLTISWWDSSDDGSAGAPHHVNISGFVYRDAAGIQHPYTGRLEKDGSGNITSDSEFEEFAAVWSPLLASDTPFKHLTVLEGSVVVTLASAATEMPAKTLVQVEFNAPPKPAPAPSGGGSDNSGNSDNNNNSESESKAATAVAIAVSDDKLQDQINRDGSIQGVRTGDDTPLTALIMLFIAFALCFSAVFGKYMRIKPGKK